MEDEYVEYIQKRIRNLQKRKVKLEGYEKTRQEDPSRLNSDQVAALANKDSVDAPLKELVEALKLYTESRNKRAEAAEQEKQAAVESAVGRGRDEGKSTLELFSQFLRTAAVKHQTHETPSDELAAVDELLQRLYMGDSTSFEAISKLAAKSQETVHGDWTYAKLYELTVPKESVQEQEPVKETKEEPQISFLQADELIDEAVADVEQVRVEDAAPATAAPAAPATPAIENASTKPERASPSAASNASADKKPQNRRRRKPSPKPQEDDGWEKAESRRTSDKNKKRVVRREPRVERPKAST